MVCCFVATHLQSMLDTRLPAAGKRASDECGKGCGEALAVFLVVERVCGEGGCWWVMLALLVHLVQQVEQLIGHELVRVPTNASLIQLQ